MCEAKRAVINDRTILKKKSEAQTRAKHEIDYYYY
jgi:hypothetical protein